MTPSLYSKYTDDCIQIIAEAPEVSSDQNLIQLVRLFRISEEIRQALPRASTEVQPTLCPPIELCVKTLHTKLNTFRENIPLNLQDNRKLAFSIFNTRDLTNPSLSQHALPRRPNIPYPNSSHSSTPLSPGNSPHLPRIRPNVLLKFFLRPRQ